jgi:hypothetical protein
MEAAEVLYGVTMEEPGLFRIVSVNLGRGGPRAAGVGVAGLASSRLRHEATPPLPMPGSGDRVGAYAFSSSTRRAPTLATLFQRL